MNRDLNCVGIETSLSKEHQRISESILATYLVYQFDKGSTISGAEEAPGIRSLFPFWLLLKIDHFAVSAIIPRNHPIKV
jgi:hypothetical protein